MSSKIESDGNARIFYFYQSLEASYLLSKRFFSSAGPFAGTILSSYQNGFARTEEEKRTGEDLRKTRLGLQASAGYHHASGICVTLNVRQDLKSIYTTSPAGPISPTSFSLTFGYRFSAATK